MRVVWSPLAWPLSVITLQSFPVRSCATILWRNDAIIAYIISWVALVVVRLALDVCYFPAIGRQFSLYVSPHVRCLVEDADSGKEEQGEGKG